MIECERFGNDYLSRIADWARKNSVPLSITFELTPFCNFSCVMCYVLLTKEKAKEQGQLLNAEEWLDIACKAKELGTLYINLTGGEPFLHPEFWKIYSQLNKMGFLISILSNGSLIDENVIRKFDEYGAPYRIKLTLYGTSNETYRRTCNFDDGFAKVSKAIDLIKAKSIPLYLSSTVVKENAHDLQSIYDFAKSKNLPIQHTTTVLKSSRGSVNTTENSRFSFDDFSDDLSLTDLEKNKFPPLKTPFAWCAGYKNSLWITWNGHLQQCSFMNKPFVRYSGDLKSDYSCLLGKLEKIKSPDECSVCKWKIFCQRCPGILCAESGAPEKVSDSLCKTAKRLYELYLTKKEETLNEKEIYCSRK